MSWMIEGREEAGRPPRRKWRHTLTDRRQADQMAAQALDLLPNNPAKAQVYAALAVYWSTRSLWDFDPIETKEDR